eukprot:scaffold126884_cov23-Tisochrysis_lutea.AAC.3
MQAEGRDLVARGSQDVSASAAQRAQLEALSRELVAEQQHLVKVASQCQVRCASSGRCQSQGAVCFRCLSQMRGTSSWCQLQCVCHRCLTQCQMGGTLSRWPPMSGEAWGAVTSFRQMEVRVPLMQSSDFKSKCVHRVSWACGAVTQPIQLVAPGAAMLPFNCCSWA